MTIAEVLGAAGYATWMAGKWHLTGSRAEPDAAWPTRRGFQHFFGTIDGAANYFNPTSLHRDETPVPESELPEGFSYTEAIADAAVGFITDQVTDGAVTDRSPRGRTRSTTRGRTRSTTRGRRAGWRSTPPR